jgi:hypothetical protein
MRACILSLAILVAGIPVAHADDPEAQKLLDEGTRLFTEQAAHDSARATFERAYAIEPSWRALNGIALTYQEQGRVLDALATYERLLVEFDRVLEDAQRSTVKARIAKLERQIAVVELVLEQAAALTIDSEDLGTGPLRMTRRLMPGNHTVVATLAGHRTLKQSITLTAGQKLPLTLVLERESERVVVKLEPQRVARRMPTWVPWTTLGTGVGLVVIGGTLHALSVRDEAAFADSVAAGSGSPPMAVPGDVELHDRARLERKLAIGGYVLGGLGAAAGAILLFLNQPRPVDIAPSGRGVTVMVRF